MSWPECALGIAFSISIAATICWCYYWWARTERIMDKGWPPPHCDADGDPVPDKPKPPT